MHLQQYMTERGITKADLAKALSVTPVAAGRYARGERLPHPRILARIEAWSERAVTASDMVEAYLARAAKKAASERAKKAAATRRAKRQDDVGEAA